MGNHNKQSKLDTLRKKRKKLDRIMDNWTKICKRLRFPKPGTPEHREWFPEFNDDNKPKSA